MTRPNSKRRELRSKMAAPARRREIVQEIFRLEIPGEEAWSSIEEEIVRAHAEGVLPSLN
jgi:hypothetical protein